MFLTLHSVFYIEMQGYWTSSLITLQARLIWYSDGLWAG
jgi:hypothetical protein